MRIVALLLAMGAGTAMGSKLGGPGEPIASPSPILEEDIRSRFLFLAVFSGLWEDGADFKAIKAICQKWDDHFIMKCPICMPVSHAFELYSRSEDVLGYPCRGKGLPKELQEGLKSSERKDRLNAILKLVERYVSRRMDQTKMSDEDRRALRQSMLIGEKQGMTAKSPAFGEFCPSCRGATQGSR